MRFRFLSTLALLVASAAVASAEAPKPALVVQTQPMSRLLVDFKEVIRQVGGTASGDAFVKEFEKLLKDGLGEKGFEGLDINRPLGAYVLLKDKLEDCGLVLVVPTITEKDFIAFLERIKIKAVAVKDKKGVYELELPGDSPFPKGSHLQFAAGNWAYVTLNDGDPTDAKDLVGPADVFNNADPSLISARVFPGRVPPKLVGLLDVIEQELFSGNPNNEGPTALKEAEEIGVKLSFDPVSGDAVTELTVVPKPGTPLAKEIAATAPTANRFAGLVTKDTAGSVLLNAVFANELRVIGATLFEMLGGEPTQDNMPEKFKPVVAEVLKGLGSTRKAGNAELAVVLNGPDAAGKFTLVAGMSFGDSAAVEKALRALAKDPDFAKEFEFDTAKVGGIGVHKVPLYRIVHGVLQGLMNEEDGQDFEKAFGAKPQGAVAFAKDAVFVAFGPGAVDAVKVALELKPAAAPALDMTANMSRFHKLFTATYPKWAPEFAKYMGTADKNVSALKVTVEGGAKLTVKATVNVRILPRIVLGQLIMQFDLDRVPPPE